MKISIDDEFSGMTTDIPAVAPKSNSVIKITDLFADYRPLILGIISFGIAVIGILFGTLSNYVISIIEKYSDMGTAPVLFLIVVLSAIFEVISIITGIFSIISYFGSKKGLGDKFGVIVSIISFVICLVSLIANTIIIII